MEKRSPYYRPAKCYFQYLIREKAWLLRKIAWNFGSTFSKICHNFFILFLYEMLKLFQMLQTTKVMVLCFLSKFSLFRNPAIE